MTVVETGKPEANGRTGGRDDRESETTQENQSPEQVKSRGFDSTRAGTGREDDDVKGRICEASGGRFDPEASVKRTLPVEGEGGRMR